MAGSPEDVHPIIPTVHFVGFRGEEYWSAVKGWGKPDMIHMWWDRRAQRDVHPDYDTVVFAKGEHDQPISQYNAPDIIEKSC